MKTLLVSEIFPPANGGSGRWFWEIYRRLPREEFVIAAGEHPGQNDFDRTHDLNVHRLPLALPDLGLCSIKGLTGYGRAFRALRRIVRTEGVRRLHCGRCVPEGWLAVLLKTLYGLPYTCYVHGEEVKLGSGGEGGVTSSRQIRWLTKKVLASAELVIANSRNTERILREDWGLAPDRIRVLYPGVDTRKFVPADRDAKVRARLGWGDRPVVLTVGRLQRRKGHDQLIRALAAVRRTIPDVLYAIVGDGGERRNLEELTAREDLAGQVQFLGELDDRRLIQCYQQCDLFVLPNRQVGSDIEGFGMVLLEAQACGRPVVAGASGGTAETMLVPGTGRIVPCEEPGPLAAVVTELISDGSLLARMGAAARPWVVDHFDWESLGRQAGEAFHARRPHGAAGPSDSPGAGTLRCR
jgi:phosphatidylinositol alpha-1,6-mannosyltransferase